MILPIQAAVCVCLFLCAISSEIMSTQYALQNEETPTSVFGDGKFQCNQMITVHGVNNVDDGVRAKIIAYDPHPDKLLYVVRDGSGNVWGLRPEKLRIMTTMDVDSCEWQEVPEGEQIPAGMEIQMNLATGAKMVRKPKPAD